MTAFIPRLYVTHPLSAGEPVVLTTDHAHYLRTVLRCETGAEIILFNGTAGEWSAKILEIKKTAALVVVGQQLRPQVNSPDIWLLFAPLKRPGIDLIAEKATELGAALLWPVLTRQTDVSRVNMERLTAQSIEAAEQCERLDAPQWRQPERLTEVLRSWPAERRLLVCAERGEAASLPAALRDLKGPTALLVGPEGGFAPEELELLARHEFVTFARLGPRILRAETAAMAALAVWQATQGDWNTY